MQRTANTLLYLRSQTRDARMPQVASASNKCVGVCQSQTYAEQIMYDLTKKRKKKKKWSVKENACNLRAFVTVCARCAHLNVFNGDVNHTLVITLLNLRVTSIIIIIESKQCQVVAWWSLQSMRIHFIVVYYCCIAIAKHLASIWIDMRAKKKMISFVFFS